MPNHTKPLQNDHLDEQLMKLSKRPGNTTQYKQQIKQITTQHIRSHLQQHTKAGGFRTNKWQTNQINKLWGPTSNINSSYISLNKRTQQATHNTNAQMKQIRKRQTKIANMNTWKETALHILTTSNITNANTSSIKIVNNMKSIKQLNWRAKKREKK